MKLASLVTVKERVGERLSKEKGGAVAGGALNVTAAATALGWLLARGFGWDVPEEILLTIIGAALALAGAAKNFASWWERDRMAKEGIKQALVDAGVARKLSAIKKTGDELTE
jgi:hypothetical protein